MAWLSRTNWINTDKPTATDFNNIGNDIRTWGGNVNANTYTLSSLSALNIFGLGQATPTIATVGNSGGTALIQDAGGSGGNGGALLFAAGQSAFGFAAIKGNLQSGANNTTGDLVISTRRVSTDSATTEAWRWLAVGTASISASAAPGTPPASTFYLWVDGTGLRAKGPSGTVTTLAVP